MKAATVQSLGSTPSYGTFDDPTPAQDEVVVAVSAAALSPLSKSQAGGSHYSSGSVFPFVPGVDGVGHLADGQRVYFGFPRSPYGSMAELVAVKSSYTIAVPNELDDVTAAAIANPGMSSWAALTRRAHFVAGETVLINGATGSAGQLAVRIAKYLGAKKIIATGRNQQALESLLIQGANTIITLDKTPEQLVAAFRDELEGGVDVVLDYLWGSSAEQLIAAISGHGSSKPEPRIRFVQIGSISGANISLSSSALRSSGLELVGSGLGSVSLEQLVASIGEMLAAVIAGHLSIETESVPLSDVETAWNSDTQGRRLVFRI